MQPLSYQPTLSFRPFESNFSEIQVFFRAAQPVRAGGSLQLQAPGFDFGDPCQSQDLPSHYYSADTLRLPQTCETSKTPWVAFIELRKRIFAQRIYGFQITCRVQNDFGFILLLDVCTL
eukprot:g8767.t1